MTIVIAGGLALTCAYLLKRAQDARAENTMLRNQIASLKRQLARMRG